MSRTKGTHCFICRYAGRKENASFYWRTPKKKTMYSNWIAAALQLQETHPMNWIPCLNARSRDFMKPVCSRGSCRRSKRGCPGSPARSWNGRTRCRRGSSCTRTAGTSGWKPWAWRSHDRSQWSGSTESLSRWTSRDWLLRRRRRRASSPGTGRCSGPTPRQRIDSAKKFWKITVR